LKTESLVFAMKPVTVAEPMHDAPNYQFGLRIDAADPPHVCTATFRA
jgi:hypothetical protein